MLHMLDEISDATLVLFCFGWPCSFYQKAAFTHTNNTFIATILVYT